MQIINLKLVEIALEYVEGANFERYFASFYASLAGIDFVPLGGMHDGGADAFQGDRVFEGQARKPGTFYQATIQQDHRAKVRSTVKRLREFGRDVSVLQFFTSRTVPSLDMEEELLSEELGAAIKIRDRKWIVANANHSPQTIAAFQTYLAPYLSFLSEPGSATLLGNTQNIAARTLCVFLGQEIDRRRGKSDLLEAVTDSLILWALEGTDPDKNILMNRNDILAKIERALPSAKHFVRGVLGHRLKVLAEKGNPTGREIRWYRQEDLFCLPFETRKIVEAENTEDEFMKLQVIDLYKSRAKAILSLEHSELVDVVATLAHRALELTFEKEGLELVEFLTRDADENQYIAISDQVDAAINEHNHTGLVAQTIKDAVLKVLRQAFYNSTEGERIYYGKLSRTYTLVLTLRNEPRIVEYFKGMSSNFVLLVGADIVVRALSERYLAPEDRMMVNTLKLLKDAGSKLYLTHMAVEEVHSHFEATDYEFRNWFMETEPYITLDIARHSGKILIRSYFYARLDPLLEERPAGWRSFIGQVCNYEDLHIKPRARDQFKRYLLERFGFEYLDEKDISRLTAESEVDDLAARIRGVKTEDVLAVNDAKHILAVYGKRSDLREDHKPTPFGYRTWWLTHEARVRQCTGKLVQDRGSQYIIRPEFILNFVALSPTTEEVRQSYATIFPTLLGVRLSNRMKEEVFHDVLGRAKEMRKVDDARARAMMSDMSNKLKGDNFKRYEAEYAQGRLGVADLD